MSQPPAQWSMADPVTVRRRRGPGLTVLVVAIIVTGGLAAALGSGLWQYMHADHLGIIDDPAVSGPASQACADLQSAVDEVPLGPAVDVIRAQDAAIGDLIAAMEALGARSSRATTQPPGGWVTGTTLLTLREAYADALAVGGQPTFDLPTVDGIPISNRMSDSGVSCPVAGRLASPPST